MLCGLTGLLHCFYRCCSNFIKNILYVLTKFLSKRCSLNWIFFLSFFPILFLFLLFSFGTMLKCLFLFYLLSFNKPFGWFDMFRNYANVVIDVESLFSVLSSNRLNFTLAVFYKSCITKTCWHLLPKFLLAIYWILQFFIF